MTGLAFLIGGIGGFIFSIWLSSKLEKNVLPDDMPGAAKTIILVICFLFVYAIIIRGTMSLLGVNKSDVDSFAREAEENAMW